MAEETDKLSQEIRDLRETLENTDNPSSIEYANDTSGAIITLNLRNIVIILLFIISIVGSGVFMYADLRNTVFNVKSKVESLEEDFQRTEETLNNYEDFKIKFDNKHRGEIDTSDRRSKKNKEDIGYIYSRIKSMHNKIIKLERKVEELKENTQ